MDLLDIGLSKSYVGLIISYIGDNKSCIGDNKSYVGFFSHMALIMLTRQCTKGHTFRSKIIAKYV